EDLPKRVFETFTHLYDRLEQTRTLIPPGRYHELRYEDLIADPLGQMRRLYEALRLGGFEEVKPHLERYLDEHATYQTNHYPDLSPELHAEITRRWGKVIQRYGYAPVEKQPAATQKAAAA